MLTGGERVRELRRVRPQLHLVAEGRTTQSRDRQRCPLHHRRQRLRLPQVRPNPRRLHHRRLRMWYSHTLSLTCWSLTTEKLTQSGLIPGVDLRSIFKTKPEWSYHMELVKSILAILCRAIRHSQLARCLILLIDLTLCKHSSNIGFCTFCDQIFPVVLDMTLKLLLQIKWELEKDLAGPYHYFVNILLSYFTSNICLWDYPIGKSLNRS